MHLPALLPPPAAACCRQSGSETNTACSKFGPHLLPPCSYPDDYPAEELTLKLTDAVGLAETSVRQLSKQLHTAAAQYAADAEVCCFQLVTLAQEYLQQHNRPPEEEAAALGPQSLYEEMLQRDTTAAAAAAGADSREQSFRAPVMGDTFFDSLLDGGGLFSDAAELPVGPPGAGVVGGSAAVPVMEVRAKPGRPPKPPPAQQQPQPSAAASKAAALGPKAELGLAPAEADATPEPEAGTAASGGASTAPAAAAAAMAAADRQGSLGRSGSGLVRVSTAAAAAAATVESSGRVGLDGPTSGGGSMLKTIGQSFRAMLPKPLRRYIEGELL